MPRVNPSRPVYTGLRPDPHATYNLVVAEGEGAMAVIDLLTHRAIAAPTTILYVANSSVGEGPVEQLGLLGARILADVPSLLRVLAELLGEATMGTRVYVSGSIGFIGEVARVAAGFGIAYASLRTEHRGRLARRVQCVHCKFTEENVVTDTVICSRCKLRLFVRDHFSHRLNAFMGVAADAEKADAETAS